MTHSFRVFCLFLLVSIVLGVAHNLKARTSQQSDEEAQKSHEAQLAEAMEFIRSFRAYKDSVSDVDLRTRLAAVHKKLQAAHSDYRDSTPPTQSGLGSLVGRSPEEQALIAARREAEWYMRTEEKIQADNDARFRELDLLRERLNKLDLDEHRKTGILESIERLQRTSAVTKVSYEAYNNYESEYELISQELSLFEGRKLEFRPGVRGAETKEEPRHLVPTN